MFTKKQMPEESVDSYANRTRKLANCIDASDETLRYAFVSGLRPKIASFVLSKKPDMMNKALDAARVAEMSLGEAQESENNELTDQLTEIRRDLKRMAEKYDSITPSAPIQNERTRSPNRRVTFEGVRDPTFGHAHCHQATTGAKMALTHTSRGQILVAGPCRCLEEEVEAE